MTQSGPWLPAATSSRNALKSADSAISRRMSANSWKVGTETTASSHSTLRNAASSGESPSRRESASATMLKRPSLYSTLKSYPINLLSH